SGPSGAFFEVAEFAMVLSLKPAHLKRYKDIAVLLVKYGRADLAKEIGIDEEVARPSAAEAVPPKAEELARDLERLGPTFIKLGQLLSTRADLLPVAYIDALARLQDDVEPFSFAEVERIVTEELGARISKAFAEFDAAPLAAASLGQVHRAVLRDGRVVAVKVQRPGVREQIADDLDAFTEIAQLLDKHLEAGHLYQFEKVVEEFRKSILRELDYRREAQNLVTLSENLAEFDRIVVPSPILDFTTGRILTMDFVFGQKITALSPLEKIDIDGARLADELHRAYLKQILIDGFFHADPHPGNVFLTDDGRVALIDLGMVGWISSAMQENLLKLLLAISEGKGEEAAERAAEIGEKLETFDETEFRRRVVELVGEYQNARLEQIQVGRVVMEVSQVSAAAGMRLPPELTMLGKTLLHLDEIGRTLDPTFDPNASVRKNAAELLQRRMRKSASPANLYASLLEAKDFVQKLPARINKVLDILANNQLRLNVDAVDERLLIDGLHKIANRIALGVILAALIVGAALLMQVPTPFRIFGYPGLAILLFLAAAFGGVWLVVSILVRDREPPPKRR
ncbi:MAG TPA: AarF/ABC1/UbiB kinase family protein, partial [Thermoanaerobaculia bacterium]|nr:AarF/ABC1/UbiB kinase family protein [Thermoanaerobaculia bacterium]